MPKIVNVAAGDCVSSISFANGFFPDTVWNHPDNADLKGLRRDPNMLVPGDKLSLPDKDPGGVDRPTGARHPFRKRGVPAMFRLQVFDGEEPRANQTYSLVVDGTRFQGATDADGVLAHWIPPNASKAELTIGPDRATFQFSFGTLQPIDETAGVQARLRNLGFECGDASGVLNDETRAALTEFQQRFGLEQTGEPDRATRDQLEHIHDKVGDFPEPRP